MHEQQIVYVLVRLNYYTSGKIQMCSQLNKHSFFCEPKITLWLCTTWKQQQQQPNFFVIIIASPKGEVSENEWTSERHQGFIFVIYLFMICVYIKCLPSYVFRCSFFFSRVEYSLFSLCTFFCWTEKGHKYVNLFFYTLEVPHGLSNGLVHIRFISFST